MAAKRRYGSPRASTSVLRVNTNHEDVRFTRGITRAVENQLEELASWLALDAVERTS